MFLVFVLGHSANNFTMRKALTWIFCLVVTNLATINAVTYQVSSQSLNWFEASQVIFISIPFESFLLLNCTGPKYRPEFKQVSKFGSYNCH